MVKKCTNLYRTEYEEKNDEVRRGTASAHVDVEAGAARSGAEDYGIVEHAGGSLTVVTAAVAVTAGAYAVQG